MWLRMKRKKVDKPLAAKSKRSLILILTILLFAGIVISFMVGKYPIMPRELFSILFSRILDIEVSWNQTMEIVLFNIRLPRILLACMVGGCLSVAGAAYQGVFQNPMAAPDVLGASTGAAFGAALAIVLGRSSGETTVSAFFFSILSIAVVFGVSKKAKGNRILALVLSGVMISSLFGAGTSFIKLVADPNSQLPAITYWMMGSLSGVTKGDLAFAAIPMLLGMIPLFLVRWRLNLLTMGEEEARTMGVNTGRLRIVIILSATLLTAASVSVSGMIGFVGLVIPHLMRRFVGSNYKYLIPASMLAGALFLLIVDDFARNLFTAELPIGILTSFMGVPFFLYLLVRKSDFAG